MIELAQAPAADIRMVNYLLNGVTPLRTNQELA
jgi:hypothetical protein